MPKKCPWCGSPVKIEYVKKERTEGPDNHVVLYQDVKHLQCVGGCGRSYYDFSRAKPWQPGWIPKFTATSSRLEKDTDFNDRLLVVGMVISAVIFVGSILVIDMPVIAKLIGVVVLAGGGWLLYNAANVQVKLPSHFPVPETAWEPGQRPRMPIKKEQEEEEDRPKRKRKSKAKKVEKKQEKKQVDWTPPAYEGPITMAVQLGGETHNLDLNAGENMLDAALDREVALEYSCREGMCDSCVVKILKGSEYISPPTQEEYDMLGDEVEQGVRLSCQVEVHGPVKIEQ